MRGGVVAAAMLLCCAPLCIAAPMKAGAEADGHGRVQLHPSALLQYTTAARVSSDEQKQVNDMFKYVMANTGKDKLAVVKNGAKLPSLSAPSGTKTHRSPMDVPATLDTASAEAGGMERVGAEQAQEAESYGTPTPTPEQPPTPIPEQPPASDAPTLEPSWSDTPTQAPTPTETPSSSPQEQEEPTLTPTQITPTTPPAPTPTPTATATTAAAPNSKDQVETQKTIMYHEGAVNHEGGLKRAMTWYAPVLSKSGFANEARSYVTMMADAIPQLRVVQFSDAAYKDVQNSLPHNEREILDKVLQAEDDHRVGAITVCACPVNQWFEKVNTGMIGDISGNDPSRLTHFDYVGALTCPPSSSGYKVGRTMFETDSIPKDWLSKLDLMDEVWVPSKFNARSFAKAGLQSNKIFVLPEAVDTEHLFNPHNVNALYPLPTAGGQHENPYKFLSVGKWEARKGMDVLLRAYFEEFSSSDPVVLYIKTQRHRMDPQAEVDRIMNKVASEQNVSTDRLPAVHVMDNVWIADTDFPSLYAAADSFVLPSRGEGWGRPQAEAMAMGLPTILTDWSGMTEYINDEVAYPIAAEVVPMSAADIQDMFGPEGEEALKGHQWAEPSLRQLRRHMRFCVSSPREAAAQGVRAREHMRKHFSPSAVQKILLDHLSSIEHSV